MKVTSLRCFTVQVNVLPDIGFVPFWALILTPWFPLIADKDHTDVLTALIMTIAGCDPNFIARRYTITRVGVEPARAIALRAFLSNKFGDPVLGRGLADVCSDHFKTMIQFLKDLKESYQCGVEGYVKDVLGFSDADLEVIRKNLIA